MTEIEMTEMTEIDKQMHHKMERHRIQALRKRQATMQTQEVKRDAGSLRKSLYRAKIKLHPNEAPSSRAIVNRKSALKANKSHMNSRSYAMLSDKEISGGTKKKQAPSKEIAVIIDTGQFR